MHEYEGQKVILAWGDEGAGLSIACGKLEKYEQIKREPLEIRRNLVSTTTINQDTFLFVLDGEEHEIKPPFTIMPNPEKPHAHKHECYGPPPNPTNPVELTRFTAWAALKRIDRENGKMRGCADCEWVECEVEIGGGLAEIAYAPETGKYSFNLQGHPDTVHLEVTPRELLGLSTAVTKLLTKTIG